MCNRCNWATVNDTMKRYHDTEWGVPLHDDQKLFEFLTLEVFQAGLSWQIVLNKREALRIAFKEFDPVAVSHFTETQADELLQNPLIIRNRQKIQACINNARCFLEIQATMGSFDRYIWRFTDNRPIINAFSSLKEIPAKTALSDKISADMKKKGFKFTGSTIIYAHMQATGMANDHLVSCFRYDEINNLHSRG